MAKIDLTLPQQFIFKTTLAIQIQHINYGNHLGHDSLISLLHEARVRFLIANNFTEMNIDGTALLIANLIINYISPAYYGETLTIFIAVANIENKGADLFYLVKNAATEQIIAQAKTGIVFFDTHINKLAAVPKVFIQLAENTSL